jgi:type I restriction enzyme S subunit
VLSRKYLYHALSVVDYEREIDQAVKGRTLNKEKLNRLRLYVPCIEEQERIARFCDTLDTEIDLQSSYIRRLQEQKRGLMQRLLTGEVRVEVEEGR